VKKRIFNSRKKVSLKSLPLYQVKKNEHRCGQHNTRDVTPKYDQRMCFFSELFFAPFSGSALTNHKTEKPPNDVSGLVAWSVLLLVGFLDRVFQITGDVMG
jgi:hypothetical protein